MQPNWKKTAENKHHCWQGSFWPQGLIIWLVLSLSPHCVCVCVFVASTRCAAEQKFPAALWLQMNTVILVSGCVVWLWDSRSPDCGRHIFSQQLNWAHIICYAAAPFSLSLLYFEDFFGLSPNLSPDGGCHSSNGRICEVSARCDERCAVRIVNDWNKKAGPLLGNLQLHRIAVYYLAGTSIEGRTWGLKFQTFLSVPFPHFSRELYRLMTTTWGTCWRRWSWECSTCHTSSLQTVRTFSAAWLKWTHPKDSRSVPLMCVEVRGCRGTDSSDCFISCITTLHF